MFKSTDINYHFKIIHNSQANRRKIPILYTNKQSYQLIYQVTDFVWNTFISY